MIIRERSGHEVLVIFPNEATRLFAENQLTTGNWDHDHFFSYLLGSWEYLWIHFQKEPENTSAAMYRALHAELERIMKETTKIYFDPSQNPDREIGENGMTGERVYTVGPVTTGIATKYKVSLETCNEAYTKALNRSMSFEQSFRESHPEATREEIDHAVTHETARIQELLEAQMNANHLEYVMNWRVNEERLKVSSDNVRVSVAKRDREYRNAVEGREPRARKEKATKEPRARIANTPEGRIEAMVQVFMKNGYSEQAARDRAKMVEAIKKVEVEPENPKAGLEEIGGTE